MPTTDINLWTTANDGTGDTLRSGGQIINGNFASQQSDINGKQDTLVSGTNIKTINGDSILWSGNIVISWGDGWAVDSVNWEMGVVVLDADDIDDTATTNKYTTAWDISKLAGIEAWADVTDSTNVNAAWAVMESNYTPAFGMLVQQSGTWSPEMLSVWVDTLVGRVTGWGSEIDDLSPSTVRALLNVEAWADVTDTTNVTAAGALMDSEVVNLAQVKAFDSTDYATAAQGTTADSALQAADIWVSVQGYDSDTAKTDVAQEYTKAQNFNATSLTDWASIAWNLEDNQVAKVTLAGNRTLAAPTNLKDGATYILTVTQDATGSRTLAYNAVFKFPWGTAPILTTDANAVDILTFISDGTNLYWVAQLDFS